MGVDVERIEADPARLAIAKHHFTLEEYAWLSALEPDERPVAFARMWTGKEAFLKALGVGLSRRMDSFQVSMLDEQNASVLTDVDQSTAVTAGVATTTAMKPWMIRWVNVVAGYAVAVAAQGEEWHVRLRQGRAAVSKTNSEVTCIHMLCC